MGHLGDIFYLQVYEDDPYILPLDRGLREALVVEGDALTLGYTPGESGTSIFGGNSNWRGPVWLSSQ